jgi:hypothetical protein
MIAPELKKSDGNGSSADEEEEYRRFGGYLPAAMPGRDSFS